MSTILIVDDEPDIVSSLRLSFELAGHTVLVAMDGHQALQQANERPDVIVLDIRLPDIDGLDVLALLKDDEAVRDIPVVMLSAHSSPSTKRRAAALGSVAYVQKPFAPRELIGLVERFAGHP